MSREGAASEYDILLLFAYGDPVMIGISSGLPAAWVVKCKKCSCTITCRAIDPQLERSEPTKSEPPLREDVVVSCSCCWTAFRYSPTEVFKGQPSPSNACPERRKMEGVHNSRASQNTESKANAAILIAASFIAAVRLNREEIKPFPSVTAKIADSIRLAEMIRARLQR